MQAPFIANTDKAWFDYLSRLAGHASLDEVNFWSPRSARPLKNFSPGEPFFLRLKSPHTCIAGYGFVVHFTTLGIDSAWGCFGQKNGDPDKFRFLRRIGHYRGVDLLDPRSPRDPLGCTVLRNVRFWPEARWIRWDDSAGWKRNIVRGRTEDDPHRAARLLAEIAADNQLPPEEIADAFVPLQLDERDYVDGMQVRREGQGSFRARLLDAYGRCAITGERTEPVLDAAHIQPYLGPRSNHIQNGLLLTKEFHTLFDSGYVAVTPEKRVIVSPRLREDWHNGRRYYEYDGAEISLPDNPHLAPSPEALKWHTERVFRG